MQASPPYTAPPPPLRGSDVTTGTPMWDPTCSVTGAAISDASDTISPYFGAVFPEINLVLSRQALPEKTGIPKVVSPTYRFWLP